MTHNVVNSTSRYIYGLIAVNPNKHVVQIAWTIIFIAFPRFITICEPEAATNTKPRALKTAAAACSTPAVAATQGVKRGHTLWVPYLKAR